MGLPAAMDTLLCCAAASWHSLPQEAIVIERAHRRFAVLGDTETKRIEPYTRTQSRRYNKPYHRIAA